MKTYVRTLWPTHKRGSLWNDDNQRDALRNYLNDMGFYVLTGAGDCLEVYVTEYVEPIDIKIAKKALDKIKKSWQTITKEK